MPDQQKQRDQRGGRGQAGQGADNSGGSGARDGATVEPEEQPASPPAARTPAEQAERKQQHDLATGEENPG
jgi:hypothetical protein